MGLWAPSAAKSYSETSNPTLPVAAVEGGPGPDNFGIISIDDTPHDRNVDFTAQPCYNPPLLSTSATRIGSMSERTLAGQLEQPCRAGCLKLERLIASGDQAIRHQEKKSAPHRASPRKEAVPPRPPPVSKRAGSLGEHQPKSPRVRALLGSGRKAPGGASRGKTKSASPRAKGKHRK